MDSFPDEIKLHVIGFMPPKPMMTLLSTCKYLYTLRLKTSITGNVCVDKSMPEREYFHRLKNITTEENVFPKNLEILQYKGATITLSLLPRSLRELSVCYVEFVDVMFPPKLKTLRIRLKFEELEKVLKNLPTSLKTLHLENEGNDILKYLPAGLKSLTVVRFHESSSTAVLPKIEKLVVRDGVIGSIPNLPESLRVLMLRLHGDVGTLRFPENLTELQLQGDFNNEIKLPPNLKKIHLNNYLFKNCNIMIPEKTEHLTLFRIGVKNNELPRLKYLLIDRGKLNAPIPDSVETLYLEEVDFKDIPTGVKKLSLRYKLQPRGLIIPHSVKFLTLTCIEYCETLVIPESVKTLSLSSGFEKFIKLPGSLRYLILDNLYVVDSNQKELLLTDTPKSLTHLRLSTEDKLMYLPESITHLKVQNLTLPVPQSVKYLEVTKSYETQLYLGDSNVEVLVRNSIHCDDVLPKNLKYLSGNYIDKKLVPPGVKIIPEQDLLYHGYLPFTYISSLNWTGV